MSWNSPSSFRQHVLGGAIALALMSHGFANAASEYSPPTRDNHPNRVYFGDTHLHTSYSSDAGMIGNNLGPEEAYRFARGEMVTASTGVKAKLARPLDFLVIADHAENLGLAPMIAENNPELLKTEFGSKISAAVKAGKVWDAFRMWGGGVMSGKDPLKGNEALTRTYWQRLTSAAEKYNEPGRFTALHGFEWSSAPGGNNLHRVVVFRDGKDKVDTVLPFSMFDSQDPEALWTYLGNYERDTGGKVLAIPHNGNLSNGLMFDTVTLANKPMDKAYAERRMRWEPIYEVTQMKGDGEAHPSISPTDEFADFETWDVGSFGPEPKTPDMLPREYGREALKRGLAFDSMLGANPFKFGMIGSTDSHTSLATPDEDNFFGKVTLGEPTTDKRRFDERIIPAIPQKANPDAKIVHAQASASGLAAVWARENTREALWDAMARKEVYATTGTRLEVRVFAGLGFMPGDLTRADWVNHGYAHGVPMGGELKVAANSMSKTAAPTLLIKAARAPDGANLDRLQVIKGWLDKSGKTHEKIYDVAWSGARKIGKNGKLPSVGNTVNVANASYSNSIGSPTLEAYWKDPAFQSSERAFYYVRVLEIPTPRWTVYDAKVFGTTLPKGVPTAIQDRAYTSPVWVTSR